MQEEVRLNRSNIVNNVQTNNTNEAIDLLPLPVPYTIIGLIIAPLL